MDISKKQLQQALSQVQNNNLQQATTICRQILTTDKYNIDALQLMGIIYIKNNMLDKAKLTFETILSITADAAAYCNLGTIFLSLGQDQMPKQTI